MDPRKWPERLSWICSGFGLDLHQLVGGPALHPLHRNLAVARVVTADYLDGIREQCLDEQKQFEKQGLRVSQQKKNRWALYTDADRLQECLDAVLHAIGEYPECRVQVLPATFLKSLALLLHALIEDTKELARSPQERKHCDAFEGCLTKDGVNSQLVKDAHRSEWTVEGQTFTLQLEDSQAAVNASLAEDRKLLIKEFQRDLVSCVETFLLEYSNRRGLTPLGTRRLMQAITTQMSQAGLANLDQCSAQASKIFVAAQGLQQRTAYNLSTMDVPGKGEALKLSIYCMKTGFSSYQDADALSRPFDASDDVEVDMGPQYCSPKSYIYQYATLRFLPVTTETSEVESIECTVIDLLDEVHLAPVEPL